MIISLLSPKRVDANDVPHRALGRQIWGAESRVLGLVTESSTNLDLVISNQILTFATSHRIRLLPYANHKTTKTPITSVYHKTNRSAN